jgi:hypothetical protein
MVLALALAPFSALYGQDYEIRLDRPVAVGFSYHLSSVQKVSFVALVKQGEEVKKQNNTNRVFEAELVVTVLAVNEKGKATKVKLEIEKLNEIKGDDRSELAPKGCVINGALAGAEEAFEMVGGDIVPDAENLLESLELFQKPNVPTDEDIFGTKDRKKVGDSWEGNSVLMLKSPVGLGAIEGIIEANKEDLKTTTTLEKIATVGKKECLQLTCACKCDKFRGREFPPEIKVEKSTMKINRGLNIPSDISLLLPSENSLIFTMNFIAKGKSDPLADEVALQTTIEVSLFRRATEVNRNAKEMTGIHGGQRATERDWSKTTMDDILHHFKASGLQVGNVVEIQGLRINMPGVLQGYTVGINGEDVWLLYYDKDAPLIGEAAERVLGDISKTGQLKPSESVFKSSIPAIVRGPFVLTNYSGHPAEAEIVKGFSSF